ncbi:MAG: hypothetical protein K6T83_04020 [Alicyclobacillus sp.]|nr:hypothetical protein [Alicyclobacillus sp.]
MTRTFSYDELRERSRLNYIMLSNRTRDQKVRRKPRSPQESEILERIVTDRVRRARETGELVRVGQKLIIRL